MTDTLLANEATIRLALFLGVLVAMAVWEVAAPRRRREIPRLIRWTNNLSVVAVDTILARLMFPWWDRLLGTYRPQPREGHETMTIGIEQFRTRRDLWLDRMLVQPLRGPASGYPINRERRRPEQ